MFMYNDAQKVKLIYAINIHIINKERWVNDFVACEML